MKVLITALILLGSINTFAQGNEGKPCLEIKSACEAAGFKKGGHKEKKGLYKDCLQPILAGQSVAGVTVGSQVVIACKEKKLAHHKTK
ncbi:MAG: hypothetical protein ACXWRE_06945 [Pseudobdellovibrionaceae bacterium]